MAPRKQAKQPAAEIVVAAANGNATPPKKRKIATKSDTEKPKPARTGSRSAKPEKHNQTDKSVISPKKLRSRTKNVSYVEVPESTTAKNNTKSKSKKITKQAGVAVDNNTDEVIEQQEFIENKQVVEKKARGKSAMTKKAGTSKKPAATKSRAKKPQDDEPTVENGDEDSEKEDTVEENSVKTPPLRRGKAVDKSDVPAAASKAKSTAKSRKRKNPEDADDAVTEAESAQTVEKDEETETVANKKIGGKSKKVETETSDAPKVKSEADIKENEGAKVVQESKQKKKKNTGKTNAVTNEKTETKGRKKKGQIVAVTDEEEATKDEITEKINLKSETLGENDVKDVASPNQNSSQEENDNNTKEMDQNET